MAHVRAWSGSANQFPEPRGRMVIRFAGPFVECRRGLRVRRLALADVYPHVRLRSNRHNGRRFGSARAIASANLASIGSLAGNRARVINTRLMSNKTLSIKKLC